MHVSIQIFRIKSRAAQILVTQENCGVANLTFLRRPDLKSAVLWDCGWRNSRSLCYEDVSTG